MKTTPRGLAFLTLALPHLLRAGITVSEPPDFSNTSPGTNYNLTTGTNTFSGTVTTGGATPDGQDNFQVTVPAGQQFLSATGSGTYPIGNVPLPAGTYGALVNESVFPNWVTGVDASEHDRALTDGKTKSLSLPFEFDALVVESIKQQHAQIYTRQKTGLSP